VLGGPVELEVTTDWDVVQAIQRGYRDALIDQMG
jgi:hypothetical protein